MALFAGRAVPTGLRHGTVTVKTEQGGVEITTLRRMVPIGTTGGRRP